MFVGFFWGAIFTIIYFFIIQNFVREFLFFDTMTQNSFAFLLIIFSPLVVTYAILKYGKRPAFAFVLLLTVSGFLSGSRAAGLLVFFGSLLGFYSPGRRINRLIWIMIGIGMFGFLMVQFSFVQDFIFYLNPRVHDLILNFEETLMTDRSYLTRVLMIEKGRLIYEQYPLFGVGLNNFLSHPVQFQGNFVGAEWVINKGLEEGTSSHNSYINILAEGGLFMFVPFVAILVSNLILGLTNFQRFNPLVRSLFFGFVLMTIHFYFITSIVNFYTWVFIALVSALNTRYSLDQARSPLPRPLTVSVK